MSRVETGPVKIGDDWTGVFIRGDEAIHYAFMLEALKDAYVKAEAPSQLQDINAQLTLGMADSLIATLKSSVEPVNEHWKVEQLEQSE